jgi:hypothetical protein
MTKNCKPEKHPDGPARPHDKAREWIIDALSLAMAGLAVSHYKPDDALATIIVFAGAYFVARPLVGLLWAITPILLVALSMMIYLCSIALAPSSVPAMLAALFLPGIAQAYWIWAWWPATGNLMHPLTLSCLVWLVLLGITVFEQNPFAIWRRRPRSNRDTA